jgi:precorrin-4 methylase
VVADTSVIAVPRILVGGSSDSVEAVREMASLARAGKRVVHLQPGDGASADHDIARLRAQGTTVEIVGGIAVEANGQTAESPSAALVNARDRYAAVSH